MQSIISFDKVSFCMKEKIHLYDHFTFRKLFRFTISPILMMLFTSIYWIVDGFFISNFAGSNEFAGVNLIFPIIMIVACVGFMFGAGGAALVGKRLGEGDVDKANRTFSLITYTTFIIGVVLSITFFFLIRPIAEGFAKINSVHTTERMIDAATMYGRIMIGGVSLYIMQGYFHPFFSVNEKSFTGFLFTLVSGLTNMLLDYLLIGVGHFGVIGAASASLTGMFISSVGPYLYFRFNKHNLIRLGMPFWRPKDILKSMTNGSSEFITNASGNIVNIIFNIQLLKFIGEDGVSAYGIIAYVSFVFFSLFLGYTVGIAPLIAYNHGSGNREELSNILSKSLLIIAGTGVAMSLLSYLFARPLAMIFVSNYPDLLELTVHAMRVISTCYFFAGFAIFGSSLFTSLNNGLISAIISFCRTLMFQIIFVFTLPLIFGVDGIWLSLLFSDALTMIISLTFIFIKRNKYGYTFVNPWKKYSLS